MILPQYNKDRRTVEYSLRGESITNIYLFFRFSLDHRVKQQSVHMYGDRKSYSYERRCDGGRGGGRGLAAGRRRGEGSAQKFL